MARTALAPRPAEPARNAPRPAAPRGEPDALAGLLARAVRDRRPVAAPDDGPVLARKHGDTPLGAMTASQVRTWEKAVRKGQKPAAGTAAQTLATGDEAHFIDLFLYKIGKHVADDPAKTDAYVWSLPFDLGVKVLERAMLQDKRPQLRRLLTLFSSLWNFKREELIGLVLAHPDEFLEVAVPDLLASGNTQGLHDMVKDRAFIDRLDEDTRARLVALIPALAVTRAVTARLGGHATENEIAAELFGAMIRHEGVDVGYVGTAIGLSAVALLDAAAERQLLDCHRLSEVFLALLEAAPGIRTRGQKVSVPEALLTVPMATLPGGLIPNTFGGNVIDDDGNPTGQIFFSGAVGMASHTYATLNGVAYDTLFGTIGDQVAASVSGLFDVWADPQGATVDGVWRERGDGGRFLVKHADRRVADNEHRFGTMYTLTRDPSRHRGGA